MSDSVKQKTSFRSIHTRFLSGTVLLCVLLMVGTAVATGMTARKEARDVCARVAFSCTRTAADLIDGDRIAQYLQPGSEDDSYREIDRYLKSTLKESHFRRFYVFLPGEDDMLIVWDADSSREAVEASPGRHEAYTPGQKEATQRALKEGPTEELVAGVDEENHSYWSAYTPIFDSQGEPVALAAVELTTDGMDGLAMLSVRNTALVILVLMLLYIAIQYRVAERGVVRPARLLTRASSELVERVKKGETFSADVHTKDEIEQLCDSFTRMEEELQNYIRDNSEAALREQRSGMELDMAAGIQKGSLPGSTPTFPGRKAFDIYATMEPAKEIGGDFYDFFRIDNDHLAMVVADVSGKGIPAALFMMVSRTIIRAVAHSGHSLSPKDILIDSNAVLSRHNKEDMFVTVWLGILELSTGNLTYADAGHERLVVYHEKEWRLMEKTYRGMALCMVEPSEMKELPEIYQIVNQEIVLRPGDVIFQYTDGVTEAMNSAEELFGEENLLEALQCAPDVAPKPLLNHIRTSVDAFVKEAPQFDDITMLAMRYRGKGGKGEKDE